MRINIKTLIGLISLLVLILVSSYTSYAQKKNKIEDSEEKAKFERDNKKAVDLAERGRYDEAMRIFRQSFRKDREVAISYHNIGYAYFLKGEKAKAKEYYKKSINRNPKLVPPRAKLGKLFYEEKKYGDAIKQGEAALKLDPKEQSVKGWLADAYKKTYETENDTDGSKETKRGSYIRRYCCCL